MIDIITSATAGMTALERSGSLPGIITPSDPQSTTLVVVGLIAVVSLLFSSIASLFITNRSSPHEEQAP